MKLYINGIGCISPQVTYKNDEFLQDVKEYAVHRLTCIEPDYAGIFTDAQARRMGRLLKYGTAAGLMALNDAGLKTPGAISTGTGLGLPEISQKFLRDMIETDETTVSPTAFIQSTHNTVSSNIALLTGCNAHNNTFSNRGFSFESALADARLIATENADNILLGAYDEISEYKYAAMKVANELKAEPCNNLRLFRASTRGLIAGEGAAFFVLSKQAGARSYAALLDSVIFYKPSGIDEIQGRISEFLHHHQIPLASVDGVISGLSGDASADVFTKAVNEKVFTDATIVAYKHLCGEYMTSSAFALWMAAQILKTETFPEAAILYDRHRQPRHLLVYNSHLGYHSLMLLAHV